MKPIRIIGGGLAGLSLGICLRRKGIPVELHEKGNYPRHKVCGEFISGITKETLARLGIDPLFDDALIHHDINWWMGSELLLTEELPAPALGISRFKLDKRLADMFQREGGQLILGKRIPLENNHNEGCVWATGKPVNPTKAKPEWIGIKIHAVNTQLNGLHMHSSTCGISGSKGGYVGLAEVENGRTNCCGLFHVRSDIRPADAHSRWSSPAAVLMAYAEACGMTELLKLMKSWQYDPESFTATAGFSLGVQNSQAGFSLGDAAWLIPPFTGNGMSMAMESSAIAATWLEKYSADEINWHEAEHGYQSDAKKHFSRRMKLSKLMHPMLFNFPGQQILKASSKTKTLPFKSIFSQLRKP
mgnify:CR=1 FL=1